MSTDLIVNFVLDRSGSMSGIWRSTVSGFNEFKNQQARLPGNAWLSLTAFDDHIEVPYVAWNCKHIPNLVESNGYSQPTLPHITTWNSTTPRTIDFGSRKVQNVPTSVEPHPHIYPRGMTALNDAILRGIEDNEKWLADNAHWFDGRSLVVILTDGFENASKASTEEVKSRIAEKEAEGWEFLYLGANQDAFAVGHGHYGIKAANTATFTADAHGTSTVLRGVTASTLNYRTTGDASYVQPDDA